MANQDARDDLGFGGGPSFIDGLSYGMGLSLALRRRRRRHEGEGLQHLLDLGCDW